MQYRVLPRSKHEQVEVRPIIEADLPAWFSILSIPIVYEHTSWNVKSAADLTHFVGMSDSTAPDSQLRLAISLRSSGELIGTVGFHSVWPPDARAEIAYDLSPTYWGQGIATEIVKLMVQWAHAEASVRRVQATVLGSNERSIAVLNRCGFAFEGVLRCYRVVRGVPGDFRMYSHVQ